MYSITHSPLHGVGDWGSSLEHYTVKRVIRVNTVSIWLCFKGEAAKDIVCTLRRREARLNCSLFHLRQSNLQSTFSSYYVSTFCKCSAWHQLKISATRDFKRFSIPEKFKNRLFSDFKTVHYRCVFWQHYRSLRRLCALSEDAQRN